MLSIVAYGHKVFTVNTEVCMLEDTAGLIWLSAGGLLGRYCGTVKSLTGLLSHKYSCCLNDHSPKIMRIILLQICGRVEVFLPIDLGK